MSLVPLLAFVDLASAATIHLQSQVEMAGSTDTDFVGGKAIDDVWRYTPDDGGDQVDSEASVTTPVAFGRATTGINFATGRMYSYVYSDPGTNFGPYTGAFVMNSGGSSHAALVFIEQFTAIGSGYVTFDLGYDGNWLVAGQPYEYVDKAGIFAPSWNMDMMMQLTGTNLTVERDQANLNSAYNLNYGIVDDKLSISAYLTDGGIYQFATYWTTFVGDAIGGLDFSHTGRLSYQTSDDLKLAFEDPRFLSDTSQAIAPVPLPAGGALLLTAICGVGVFSLRNRRPRSA